MGVLIDPGYLTPPGDKPLSCARIAHSGNWFAGGSIVASDTAAGFFADAPDNSLTYEKWSPATVPATWETDLGAARQVDYCLIAAHDLGTVGASINVQYWDGAAWLDLLSASQAVSGDLPVFVLFAPVTAQRWRINIVSAASAPKISVIRFGKAMQFSDPAIIAGHVPLDMARAVTMRTNNSVTGEWLGRSRLRAVISGEFRWTYIPEGFGRGALSEFLSEIEEEAFAIAWRPDLYPQDVAYCWINGSQIPAPVDSGAPGLMNFSLPVRAYADR